MQVMLVTSDTTLLGQMYNVMNDIMQVEALERVKKRKAEGDQTDEKTLLEEELPKIVLNPNVFTDFKVSGDPEDIAADEELVRKAGQYLVDTVLPKLVVDLSSLEVSPMDGPTLTDALHAHGINVRYLGKVWSSLILITALFCAKS
jgi:protein TIF31